MLVRNENTSSKKNFILGGVVAFKHRPDIHIANDVSCARRSENAAIFWHGQKYRRRRSVAAPWKFRLFSGGVIFMSIKEQMAGGLRRRPCRRRRLPSRHGREISVAEAHLAIIFGEMCAAAWRRGEKIGGRFGPRRRGGEEI